MAFPGSGPIWFDGAFVPWEEAKIHVLSHVAHYGSGVFEGIRCYGTKNGPAVFRMREHVRRMFDSAKIYRMPIPFTQEEIEAAILETIRRNGLDACYIRPLVFRGYGQLGVSPVNCPVNVIIAVWEWGKYLGPEALEQGVNVCVASWNRPAANTFPSLAKASGNYLNSQLVKLEAMANGYDEGIVLDTSGYVAEGSGENIFVVRDGILFTPPTSSSLLPGITRNSVITLARELNYTVREEQIPREALYIADEVFFTGTAAEITPIATIDKVPIGSGKRGPVTKEIQDALFGILDGTIADRHGWLTSV
ncbi:MAG TPA: branched-chain amino acid transaminase [Candidatus Latescibacteria bacterium]|nr:branched-chain amino acid transaminase [Candidatus Latescibacterota bacterium]HOS63322.1 branched-chain amino acid transaminase [Candidatus Latescibacterota bacterium]HPK74495.1 branched-chain amino acid transaminase [Candidatus Latescibacterota bacterium]